MSDNKRLLHERFREAADFSKEVDVDEYTICLYPEEASAIADEIEREYIPREEAEAEKRQIIESQADSVLHIMKLYAENKGIPMEDGESITKWLDRWFIPRPRFKDGEPVQFGCKDIAWVRNDQSQTPWRFTAINEYGRPMATAGADILACAAMTNDGFVKRLVSEVLDADGVPIKVGDTVWKVSDGWEMTVSSITIGDVTNKPVVHVVYKATGGKDVHGAKYLTHREPDTQEKIDADKKKCCADYWNCFGVECRECHASMYGKSPTDFYETPDCSIAQGLDIARRQAMLDARMRED